MQRLGRKCFLTKDIMFIPSLSLQFQVTPEKCAIAFGKILCSYNFIHPFLRELSKMTPTRKATPMFHMAKAATISIT